MADELDQELQGLRIDGEEDQMFEMDALGEPAAGAQEDAEERGQAEAAAEEHGEADDMTCAICLERTQLVELALVKGCEHQYCVNCILQWSMVKECCPQCKQPFDYLLTHKQLDGTLTDYLAEESVVLLKRARWFEEYLRDSEKGRAMMALISSNSAAAAAAAAAATAAVAEDESRDWADVYEDYLDAELEEDEEMESYYFSSAAGRARVVLGNRRWGEGGFMRAGRMYARPVVHAGGGGAAAGGGKGGAASGEKKKAGKGGGAGSSSSSSSAAAASAGAGSSSKGAAGASSSRASSSTGAGGGAGAGSVSSAGAGSSSAAAAASAGAHSSGASSSRGRGAVRQPAGGASGRGRGANMPPWLVGGGDDDDDAAYHGFFGDGDDDADFSAYEAVGCRARGGSSSNGRASGAASGRQGRGSSSSVAADSRSRAARGMVKPQRKVPKGAAVSPAVAAAACPVVDTPLGRSPGAAGSGSFLQPGSWSALAGKSPNSCGGMWAAAAAAAAAAAGGTPGTAGSSSQSGGGSAPGSGRRARRNARRAAADTGGDGVGCVLEWD